MLTNEETLLGRGPIREQEGKGIQESCAATWLPVLDFMVMGLVSGLPLANHSDSGFFLVARTLLSQDAFLRWGFCEIGRTSGVSFWPFPNSSGWWWLVSFIFFTRTTCHKTTHANGCYGAWPGWAVSLSVSPNRSISLTNFISQSLSAFGGIQAGIHTPITVLALPGMRLTGLLQDSFPTSHTISHFNLPLKGG